MKAFSVLEKEEYTGDIFFAEKRIVAAKNGANEYADGELGGVQCRRAPWADIFAGKGVPAKVAVDHGWRFECSGCGITVDSDLEYEHRKKIGDICGTMHGAVYCSPRCKWRTRRDEDRRKAKEQEIIQQFKDIVLLRFPEVEFADGEDRFQGHHVYIDRRHGQGNWHIRQATIGFNFPGMKIGPAHFRLEDNHSIGPAKAYYTCCNGDREAFEAYAASTRAALERSKG